MKPHVVVDNPIHEHKRSNVTKIVNPNLVIFKYLTFLKIMAIKQVRFNFSVSKKFYTDSNTRILIRTKSCPKCVYTLFSLKVAQLIVCHIFVKWTPCNIVHHVVNWSVIPRPRGLWELIRYSIGYPLCLHEEENIYHNDFYYFVSRFFYC